MPGTFLCTTSLLNLPVAHPAADDILRKGGLSVSRSNVPGSRNPIDKTTEQTINHHIKSAGGIVGFSRNIPAYHRWCVTRHALLKWQVWTALLTPFTKHLRPAQIQQSEEDVTKLCKAFRYFINPFDIECVTGGCIVTQCPLCHNTVPFLNVS